MSSRKRQEAIPTTLGDFSGGEADLPVSKFPVKFSTKMVNWHPTQTGGVAFVPGYARVNQNAANEAFQSGHTFIKADGTKIRLVAGGGQVYRSDGTTLTVIKSGLNAAAIVRFITANNYCIMMNGVDAPMKYDGTSVTALGGSPPATAFKGVFYKGRVWMIERTNKLLASYSGLLAIEDYTSAHNAGYLDFTKILKTGDELTDIESYVDLLVFYFKNHVVVYSGNTPTDYGDFQIVTQIEGAGAITDTVCSTGLDHYFLSQIGVRSLRQAMQTGADAEDLISKNIAQRLSGAYQSNATGTFASAHFQRLGWYMLLIGDEILCYAYNRGAWFRIAGADILGMFSDSDGSTVYICGRGFLYQYDIGWTFDGKPIYREWDGAWLKFFKNQEKGFPKVLEIYATPGQDIELQLAQRFDLNQGFPDGLQTFTVSPAPSLMDEPVPDIWENCFFMDCDDYVPDRFPLFGSGSTMQLCFSSTTPNGPCEINSEKMLYTPGGD